MTVSQITEKKKYSKLFRTFSIFALLNFLPSLFIIPITGNISHDLIIYLRLIASVLCVLLSLHEYWSPKISAEHLSAYWNFTLFFSLPFIASYTVLVSGYERYWIINALLSFLLFYIFTNPLTFSLFSIIGCMLGYICYQLLKIEDMLPSNTIMNDVTLAAHSSSFIGLVIAVSLYERDKERRERVSTIEILSDSIAHETKTPLASVEMQSVMLADILKEKFKGDPKDLKEIEEIISSISKVAKSGCKSIEILLTAIRGDANEQEDLGIYSLARCVNEALEEYPMQKEVKTLVNWDNNTDILFYGSNYLVKHVIFNLLKNTFAHSGKNTRIDMWIDPQTNSLHYKDYGRGIPPDKLNKIFNRFYTSSDTGTGVGLSFCKTVMNNMGGEIKCNSEVGKYTEFTLMFKYIDSA